MSKKRNKGNAEIDGIINAIQGLDDEELLDEYGNEIPNLR